MAILKLENYKKMLIECINHEINKLVKMVCGTFNIYCLSVIKQKTHIQAKKIC